MMATLFSGFAQVATLLRKIVFVCVPGRLKIKNALGCRFLTEKITPHPGADYFFSIRPAQLSDSGKLFPRGA